MSEFEIDEKTRAALGRLTVGEKECLKRRLRHQTAKEMALDLGISPHAVEKRLKMARAKLGLSSSLEAARLMVASERYQQTAPQAPDLETPTPVADKWFTRPLALGVIGMSILAAIVLAYTAQTNLLADAEASPNAASDAPDTPQFVSASASPEQVEEYLRTFFARFDRDESGFIERSEGPSRIELAPRGDADRSGDVLAGQDAWERFLSDNADNGDGKISFAEFRSARYEQLLRDGIPVRREDVALIGERQSPYRERQPGEGPVRHSVEELEFVEASPERVRAYVRQMFDNWDTDESGFIEMTEAPDVLIIQLAKMGADGKATYDPDDPGKKLEGDAARKQYIANVDKDDDGRVSFEEFAEPVMPQYLRRGIPLIPADWTPAPPSRR